MEENVLVLGNTRELLGESRVVPDRHSAVGYGNGYFLTVLGFYREVWVGGLLLQLAKAGARACIPFLVLNCIFCFSL